MQFAIFDTGAGFLQWLGEAAHVHAAIQAMWHELELSSDSSGNESADEFILVYELSGAEFRAMEQAVARDEEVLQDFAHEGLEFTYGEVLSLVGA